MDLFSLMSSHSPWAEFHCYQFSNKAHIIKKTTILSLKLAHSQMSEPSLCFYALLKIGWIECFSIRIQFLILTFASRGFLCSQFTYLWLLEQVEIHSGRPHQIRIHLSLIGYPLLGKWLWFFWCGAVVYWLILKNIISLLVIIFFVITKLWCKESGG